MFTWHIKALRAIFVQVIQIQSTANVRLDMTIKNCDCWWTSMCDVKLETTLALVLLFTALTTDASPFWPQALNMPATNPTPQKHKAAVVVKDSNFGFSVSLNVCLQPNALYRVAKPWAKPLSRNDADAVFRISNNGYFFALGKPILPCKELRSRKIYSLYCKHIYQTCFWERSKPGEQFAPVVSMSQFPTTVSPI